MQNKKKNYQTNFNKRTYMKKTLSQRAADRASRIIGSWYFIFFQTAFILAWVFLNTYAFINHWDIFPFIFLNLSLSVLATYSAPIILMSQNRDAERDRSRATNDLATDRKTQRDVQIVKKMLERMERKIDKK
jgi:uncharacterized membrane protein